MVKKGKREMAQIIRRMAARIAIYRKLKRLGHSDDTIVTVYTKSLKRN